MIHPKKGSPSGRNAYPVTEKMEELKKEEKNDMAKKKTFQEYTQEALLEIEKTEESSGFLGKICRLFSHLRHYQRVSQPAVSACIPFDRRKLSSRADLRSGRYCPCSYGPEFRFILSQICSHQSHDWLSAKLFFHSFDLFLLLSADPVLRSAARSGKRPSDQSISLPASAANDGAASGEYTGSLEY